MTQESNKPPITDALWRQMRADIAKEAKQRETLAEKDALIKELANFVSTEDFEFALAKAREAMK